MGNASQHVDEITRLAARYHQEMIDSFYLLSKEYGYRATYFLRMVEEHGGVEASRRLLSSASPGGGLARLWELKRLDLSVEASVLLPEYQALFTDDERKIARERLSAYGYYPSEPEER
jgi:hypothetical protein